MRSLAVLIVLMIGVSSCGSEDAVFVDNVNFYEIPRWEIVERTDNPNVQGVTYWDNETCIIYVMAPEEYRSRDQFLAVVGHEMYCHCVLGLEHPTGVEVCE